MITDMIATAKRVTGRGHFLGECWSSGVVGAITSTSSVVHREGPVWVCVANSINSCAIEEQVDDDVGDKLNQALPNKQARFST